jgi:hypothetical protein
LVSNFSPLFSDGDPKGFAWCFVVDSEGGERVALETALAVTAAKSVEFLFF